MTLAELGARIGPLVEQLYPDRGTEVCERLVALAEQYAERLGDRRIPLPSHGTVYLITYGDAIRRDGETPLHTLARFLHDHVGDAVSDVHLLPMFPWTSDDGFAVVDHRLVNPALGTWDDIGDLAAERGVMLDFVANHTSSHSTWFRDWLAGDPSRAGFYLERDPGFDVSRVVRPGPRRCSTASCDPTAARSRPGRRSVPTRSTSTSATRGPSRS